MAKRVKSPDTAAADILTLQRRYAEAVLARGDLSPEIMEKFRLFQRLAAETKRRHSDPETVKRAADLAIELLPYFHFKVDDIDWSEQ